MNLQKASQSSRKVLSCVLSTALFFTSAIMSPMALKGLALGSGSSESDLSVALGNSTVSGSDYYYSNATVTGSGIKTILISFSGNVSSNDKIDLPTSTNNFVVSTTSQSNNYTKRINIDAGADAADVQSYLREIGFELDNSHTLQSVKVTLTTEDVQYDTFYNIDTEHYYQYVPYASGTTDYSWTTAYNAAENMEYMSRTGYLATVTSYNEDIFLNSLSNGSVGWLGGTALNPLSENGALYYSGFDTASASGNDWYWADGPERGQTFYYGRSSNRANYGGIGNGSGNSPYWNWGIIEPNGSTAPTGENCLTTLVRTDGYTGCHGTNFSWNGITYNHNGSGNFHAQGFFVEYGDLALGGEETVDATKYASAGGIISSAVYAATVNVTNDGSPADGPDSVTLHRDDISCAMTETDTGVYTASVPAGTYSIYVGNSNTGTNIEITNTDVSANLSYTSLKSIAAISGTAQVGSTLTAGAVSPSGAPVTYQWLESDTENANYTAIDAGATDSTYTLTAADTGKYIEVSATGTGNYLGTVTSNPISAVAAPSVTPAPVIAGTPTAGDLSLSGTSVAGASISVTINSSQYTTTADSSGNWSVNGFTLAAGDSISVTATLPSDTVSTAATATAKARSSDSGSGSTSTSPSSPEPIVIDGGNKDVPGNTNPSNTATITPDNTNTGAVSDITVNLPDVTIEAPPSVLNSALDGDSSWLKLSQNQTTATTQTAARTAAASQNITPVAMLDVNLTRYYSNGTTEPVHQLSGSVMVTIRLTATQIAQITDPSQAHLLYYNPDTGTLSDMGATFDLAKGTVSFQSSHFSTFVIATEVPVGVTYQEHVQNIGWQGFVNDGVQAGTTGKSLRGEAVQIKLTGDVPAGASILYQAHVQNLGWMTSVSNGAVAGTTGRSLRLEALKITLANMPGYEVQYRAHVQNLGWLPWQTTANGTDISSAAVAGTTGKSLRLEAIEIRVVKAS